MKVIDATWEKRNLGVSTMEIEVEEKDTKKSVLEVVREADKTAEYVVVKIPVGDYELMQLLEKEGYSFIECQLRTEGDKKTYEQESSYAKIPAIRKLNEKCTYAEMDEADLQQLYQEIDKSVFDTDRIYLDPYFRKQQAAGRYKYWIQDELSRGSSKAYKVEYGQDTVGFFIHREVEKDVYQGILMGVYEEYKNTGFGYIVDLKEREQHAKKKCRSFGYISSNNISRVKLFFSEPSILTDIKYVYIKHNNK